MIYAGYVKIAPGKRQTGRVKLKISPGSGESKFSPGEGEKSTWSNFTEYVTEGCFYFLKKIQRLSSLAIDSLTNLLF